MVSIAAALAANRFGLGAALGEMEAADRDPAAWLLQQLKGDIQAPPLEQDTRERLAHAYAWRKDNPEEPLSKLLQSWGRDLYTRDVIARYTLSVETERPFAERLVHFWADHFTVSVRRPALLPVAGSYEAEAIRPNLQGSFLDLLRAVVGHQAMLLYLDNNVSVGPNSKGSRKGKRGLNENLAREILELHTLGVEGGYTQDDVRSFALILTGWTVQTAAGPDPGAFAFDADSHEPGEKTLLGKTFAEAGQEEAEQALALIAAHPSTARFVSWKLLRHFLADPPPPKLVNRLAKAFSDSDGSLPVVYETLLGFEESWRRALRRVRKPEEMIVAASRAASTRIEGEALLRDLRRLDQEVWGASSPAGWPEEDEAWMGSQALLGRLQWCRGFPRQARGLSAQDLLSVALGPLATRDLATVAGQEERAAGITLVLMSPAFQRR